MKRLLLGLMVLGSTSAFAAPECGHVVKIQTSAAAGFSNTAYLNNGVEVSETAHTSSIIQAAFISGMPICGEIKKMGEKKYLDLDESIAVVR